MTGGEVKGLRIKVKEIEAVRDVVRLRTSWYAAIRTLSPEDGGRLFQAILDYAITGKTPALSGAAQTVYVMIAADIDEDNERDKKISAIRSAAGARGAAKTNAGKSRQKAAIAGTDRQMPANAGLYQEKSAKVSKCRQMPTDAPEGPRIKALDSVPAAPGAGTEEAEEGDINIYHSVLPSSEMSGRPSVGEVTAYCQERGYIIDAKDFVDYYDSKDWRVGNDPIRDWKAFVRIWERNEKQRERSADAGPPRPAKTVAAQQYSQRDYSDEDEEAFARMLAAAKNWGIEV